MGNGNEEHLESYAVERLQFDYAVPVLTGWDMQYACEDHEIERIGVYLVEFEYYKDPNAPTGTLYYTIFSTMRDDSDNGHYLPSTRSVSWGSTNWAGVGGPIFIKDGEDDTPQPPRGPLPKASKN